MISNTVLVDSGWGLGFFLAWWPSTTTFAFWSHIFLLWWNGSLVHAVFDSATAPVIIAPSLWWVIFDFGFSQGMGFVTAGAHMWDPVAELPGHRERGPKVGEDLCILLRECSVCISVHRRSYHRGPWALAQTFFFSFFLNLIVTVTWQWQLIYIKTLPSRWSTRIFITGNIHPILLSNLCWEIARYTSWLMITVLLYMFHCNQWPNRRHEQAEDSFHIFPQVNSEANTCVTVLWC